MHISKLASLGFWTLACITASGQTMNPDKVYPKFAVGPTGIYATIEKGQVVTVQEIAPNSPAAQSPLKPGDLLLKGNNQSLAVPDPRVPLGTAIGAAEAGDGALNFVASRGGKQGRGTVSIRKAGQYAKGWPEDCAKSAAIIKATASYIAANQQKDGAYRFDGVRPERDGLTSCLASLFLLSTGDPQYLPIIKAHALPLAAKVEEQPTTSNWHLGSQGILLAEYYLKTGDHSLLPGLKSLCDQAVNAGGRWLGTPWNSWTRLRTKWVDEFSGGSGFDHPHSRQRVRC